MIDQMLGVPLEKRRPVSASGSVGKPGGTGGIPTKYSQAKIGLSLFNLEEDTGETTDVKAKHPKVLAKMQALGQAMRKELGDQGKKGSGQRDAGRLAKR